MADSQDGGDSGMTMPASNDDLISAGLLSWAKDVRYVNELQSLLVNAGDALVSGRLRRSVLTKGSWYASFLLYLIFVLGPKGKSLGMAASGLEFTSSMAGNSKEIRRSILATLLTVVAGVGALDWWASSKDREVVSASDDLRGIDRRQRHQMLRQQMFERSSGSTMASSNESAAQVGSQDLAWYEKSTEYVQKSLRSLFRGVGIETARNGPHLMQSTYGSTSSSMSALSWVIKLHLAQYLVTGKFPTILHRLLGIGYKLDGGGQRILARPNTHRLIAILIGIQASSSLIRGVMKRWTDMVARYLEQRKRKREQILSVRRNNLEGSAKASCAICLGKRTFPAVVATCGHVFCWNCLNHWVASVNQACPYCRVSCKESDIQPLFSYDFVTDGDER